MRPYALGLGVKTQGLLGDIIQPMLLLLSQLITGHKNIAVMAFKTVQHVQLGVG